MTKGSKSKITHDNHVFRILFLNVWYETWRRLKVTAGGQNPWRKCVRVIQRSCLGVDVLSRPDLGASIVFPDWWYRLMRLLTVMQQQRNNLAMCVTLVPVSNMFKSLLRSF